MLQENLFTAILKLKISREEKAKKIADIIRQKKNYSWVGLYDVLENEIKIISWSGISSPAFPSFPITKGLNGKAVESKKTIVVNDVSNDPDYLTTFSYTNSEIIIPVISQKSEVTGTIGVESESRNAFNDEDILFLEECAKHLQNFWEALSNKNQNKIMKAILFLSSMVFAILFLACSREKIIGLKQNIHHDDFEYSVQNIEKNEQIGNKKANGMFYIVTFRVENDAKRVDHEWANDIAYIIDENGNQYDNDNEAQKELNNIKPFGYKDGYVTKAGVVESTMFVFDIPKDVKEPYLLVRGEFLMGDMFDGSQFKKTKVKLF